MAYEILQHESSKDYVRYKLEDEVAGMRWVTDDQRNRFNTGYIRYYRDRLGFTLPNKPAVYEENLCYFRFGRLTDSKHVFMVNTFSGESEDRSSADLMTTYGIDGETGTLVVTQVIGPGKDDAEVSIGSLTVYEEFGIDNRTEQEQWERLAKELARC